MREEQDAGVDAESHFVRSGIKRRTDIPSPRCPHLPTVERAADLLPYLDSVARRPYSTGLWPAWDLQEGERVLVRTTSWHDPMVIEAVEETLRRFNTDYTIEHEDKGDPPTWEGSDEVQYYLDRVKELARWMDEWEELDRRGVYDKIIMGYGGPILAQRKTKIQRLPFITPEQVASPAHLTPAEVLVAIDEWTWDKVREARTVRLTDPEGTDIRFTNRDEYWSPDRSVYRRDHVERTYSSNVPYGETYLPGHVWGRPSFHIPGEDGTGVIAGTMNHIAPFPRMEMTMERSEVTEIRGGGDFGRKLQALLEETRDVDYPGFETPGIMKWWEASIGTNPKIHRPRVNYPVGYNCGLYERMRAGVVHIGFGTVISSDPERQAAKDGKLVGHWHVHLYFPTYVAEGGPNGDQTVIEHGRLKALDDDHVRDVAAKYGDPDEILREDWIPAIPGLNLPGNYDDDFAEDPMDWTLTELHVCHKFHPLFMQMIGDDGGACH